MKNPSKVIILLLLFLNYYDLNAKKFQQLSVCEIIVSSDDIGSSQKDSINMYLFRILQSHKLGKNIEVKRITLNDFFNQKNYSLLNKNSYTLISEVEQLSEKFEFNIFLYDLEKQSSSFYTSFEALLNNLNDTSQFPSLLTNAFNELATIFVDNRFLYYDKYKASRFYAKVVFPHELEYFLNLSDIKVSNSAPYKPPIIKIFRREIVDIIEAYKYYKETGNYFYLKRQSVRAKEDVKPKGYYKGWDKRKLRMDNRKISKFQQNLEPYPFSTVFLDAIVEYNRIVDLVHPLSSDFDSLYLKGIRLSEYLDIFSIPLDEELLWQRNGINIYEHSKSAISGINNLLICDKYREIADTLCEIDKYQEAFKFYLAFIKTSLSLLKLNPNWQTQKRIEKASRKVLELNDSLIGDVKRNSNESPIKTPSKGTNKNDDYAVSSQPQTNRSLFTEPEVKERDLENAVNLMFSDFLNTVTESINSLNERNWSSYQISTKELKPIFKDSILELNVRSDMFQPIHKIYGDEFFNGKYNPIIETSNYELGQYEFPDFNLYVVYLCSLLNNIKGAFSEILSEDNISIEIIGGADATPYRGDIKLNKDIFSIIEKEMVCDAVSQEECASFHHLKHGTSSEKNKALAFLRGFTIYNSMHQNCKDCFELSNIYSFVSDKCGGEYRYSTISIEIEIDINSLKNNKEFVESYLN